MILWVRKLIHGAALAWALIQGIGRLVSPRLSAWDSHARDPDSVS